MENVSFEFLKSKRFISAASYVVALILVAYLPIFEGMELDIASGLTIVFGILIGGYALEDIVQVFGVARAMAKRTETPLDDAAIESLYTLLMGLNAGAQVTPPAEVNVNVGGAAH